MTPSTAFRAFAVLLAAAASSGAANDVQRVAHSRLSAPYDIPWHTIDGGGVTWATGGTYRVGATIGQSDAGPAALGSMGGDYRLVGGFWGAAQGVPPPPPLTSPPGKNRYLTVDLAAELTQGDSDVAIRVEAVDLPDFPGAEGGVWWSSVPFAAREGGAPAPTFSAGRLTCTPAPMALDGVEAVQLYGEQVVSSRFGPALYGVRFLDAGCVPFGSEACLTTEVMVPTGKWGDVRAPFFPAGGQPNFIDISAIVAKFQGLPGAIPKAQAQLWPNLLNPDAAVDFASISAAVSAFQGLPYPFSGPGLCP